MWLIVRVMSAKAMYMPSPIASSTYVPMRQWPKTSVIAQNFPDHARRVDRGVLNKFLVGINEPIGSQMGSNYIQRSTLSQVPVCENTARALQALTSFVNL